MTYEIECKNCGEIITISDMDIDNQDMLYIDCNCCDYQNEVEVTYDEAGNIMDFRVF